MRAWSDRRMYRMKYWGALALVGSLVGCTADGGDTDTDTGPGTTGSESAGTDTGTGTDTPPTTTEDPTGGNEVECDPIAQDCPEGLKCTAYAKELVDTWDANKCVPETNTDNVAGDPCEVEGGIATGIDNCAKGYICLNTDSEGKDGACVEFCAADMTCPNTSGGAGICIVTNDGTLPICLATCDPLMQDCPGQQACYGDPGGPPFFCFGPDPKDGGQDGSTCEFTNACLAGLQCNDSATLEGCPADSIGCCTPFCPLDGDVCTGAEECVSFFAEPTPGFENVGICVLPG